MHYSVESQSRLAPLLDAAQQEPVFIERNEKNVAVLLSVGEYDRVSESANLEFQEFCDAVSDRVAGRGLTESKLNDLLHDA